MSRRFYVRDDIIVTEFLVVIPLQYYSCKSRLIWLIHYFNHHSLVFIRGMLDERQARLLRRYLLTIQ